MANIRSAKPLLSPSIHSGVSIAGVATIVAALPLLLLVGALGSAPASVDTLSSGDAVAVAPPGDLDRDGIPNARDADRDNDGWLNVDDPKPDSGVLAAGTWYANIDNDAVADYRRDADDDNDGTLDTRDRRPNDIDDNGVPDPEERRKKGERYDGDGDGKPDLAEFRKVALAQMDKLGIKISHTVRHLADLPPEVFKGLPEGWIGICQDKDNDGLPNAIDKFDRSLGGSYENYVSDGKWEESWEAHRDDWQKYGFVSTGIAGILGEPPRYEAPKEWVSGYVPGTGFTTGGLDYGSFYGHIPTSEQHFYTPPPGEQRVDYGGGAYYSPPPEGGFLPPPPQYHEGSTGAPPPAGYSEPPHVEPPHPPPPPPPPPG